MEQRIAQSLAHFAVDLDLSPAHLEMDPFAEFVGELAHEPGERRE